MTAFLADLMRHPTENPPGRGYRVCLEAIAAKLSELGFESRVAPVPGGDADPNNPRHWLSASWGGANRRALYFHGHVDVVPAFDHAQFEPRVTRDTIFGRGSTDMKGGLVAMIYAMRALVDCGIELDGKIALRIVPDEETGGALGSRALLDAGDLLDEDTEPVAMLTAEPTGGVVWSASRGAITGNVRTEGRNAHVGHAYRGANAFERGLDVANALRALKEDVGTRTTSFPIEPEAARRSILLMGGEVEGGANFNVVPDRFLFSVDRRINPEEDYDEEKRRLIETVTSSGGTFELFQEARPAACPPEHPAARALAAAFEEVKGEPARFELCPGILEIRFYAEKGIPAFAYGPGLLSVAHGPNEFVKRAELEDCALIYALTAARLLS